MSESSKHRQNFQINLKIGDVDYTSNLQRFRMVSSLASMYPVVLLSLLIESETVITNELFGKDDMVLSLTQVFEDMTISEQLNLDLIYVKCDDIELKIKPATEISNDPAGMVPDVITITCLLKTPLENLSTEINHLFQEDFQKPTVDAIKEICSTYVPSMNTEISDADKNENPLPRTFNVGRLSVSDVIRYLDDSELGGLYNSPKIAFHSHEKLMVKSTKEVLQGRVDYTIHLLTSTGDITTIIEKCSASDDNFYTRTPIVTNYQGQQNIANMGGTHQFRVKPDNKLYDDITVSYNEVLADSSAQVSDYDMRYLHPSISNIKKFTDVDGYNDNKTKLKKSLGVGVADSSKIFIQISRNITLNKLLYPGTCMELKTYALDYVDYNGKYVTFATDIQFSRSKSEVYNCVVKLNCIRSNVLN